MSKPDLEWQKREISAALDGVIEGEKAFKQQHGIDIVDEDDWIELGEIVKRIERRLAAKMHAKPSEAAE
jgi:hypothetical protein